MSARVTVYSESKEPLSLDVRLSSPLSALKAAISKRTNIRVDAIKLNASGSELTDDARALSDYGIKDGSDISMAGKTFQALAKVSPARGRGVLRTNTGDRRDMDNYVQREHDRVAGVVETGLCLWITSVLDERVEPPVCAALASGVRLCDLFEKVAGFPVDGVHRRVRPGSHGIAQSNENIALFAKACVQAGVHEQDIMTAAQLAKGETDAVVRCLMALLRKAHARGVGEISEELLDFARLPKGYSPQKEYVGRSKLTKAERELSDAKEAPGDGKHDGDADADGPAATTTDSNEPLPATVAPPVQGSSGGVTSKLIMLVAGCCIIGPIIASLITRRRKRS